METKKGISSKVTRKNFTPSWRKAFNDLFPEDEQHLLSFDYFVEDVRTPNPYLPEYLRTARETTTRITMNTTDGSTSRIERGPITGEFFSDNTTAYTFASIKHEDLVEAEGKQREDVNAHYKLYVPSKESGIDVSDVNVFTIDLEKADPLIRFILLADLPDITPFFIHKTDDLFNPYENAEFVYEGTIADYRKIMEGKDSGE